MVRVSRPALPASISGPAAAASIQTCHEMAAIRGRLWLCESAGKPTNWGQTMKILRGAKLFAPPKRKQKTKDWLDRVKLVVAAARERAVERAQQLAAPSMKRPPAVLQRRRLAERLSAR